MQNGFGVAMRLVDVTPGFERLAKIGVVVDLAVVSDVQRRIFIGHRLMTTRDVDNTQTAMAQSDVTVDEDAFVVRTAMRDHVAHPPRGRRVRNRRPDRLEKAIPLMPHIFLYATH